MDRPWREATPSRVEPVVRVSLLIAAVAVTAFCAATMSRSNAFAGLGATGLMWGAYVAVLLRNRRGTAVTTKATAASSAATTHARPGLIDEETGLGNGRYLQDLLRREMARCDRYGGRLALSLFDVRVVDSQGPGDGDDAVHSPARWVASRISHEFRQADLACRIDETHFVVLLTEAEVEGARAFTERLRTSIGTRPFAKRANGSALYARAWAGSAAWAPEMTEPEALLAAAQADIARTQPEYEADRAWFVGGSGR